MYAAIIAAAGSSTRFPGNKLLFEYEGEPLVVRAVRAAAESAVDAVVVVTGHMRDEVVAAIERAGLGPKVVEAYNPRYGEGMSSSVRAGVERALQLPGLKAVLFAPGDAAWIPSAAYDLLIHKHAMFGWKIAVAAHLGRPGHPVLFDASLAGELLKVEERTRGLKGLMAKMREDVRLVEMPFPTVLLDLDTVLDLNRVKAVALR